MNTKQRNDNIIHLVKRKGHTFGEVSKKLGVSRSTVAGVVDRNKKKTFELSFEERTKKYEEKARQLFFGGVD